MMDGNSMELWRDHLDDPKQWCALRAFNRKRVLKVVKIALQPEQRWRWVKKVFEKTQKEKEECSRLEASTSKVAVPNVITGIL